MINQQKLFDKYLELLEVEFSSPTFDSLRKIVKAHLIKVSFENISKLLYKKRGMRNIPDLSTFLNGIEKYKFGGTCYSNNYYLFLLLDHLGYKIKLCGADMKNPDVHIISIVTIDEQEYIVDCGYAAPFFNPLPTNLKEDYHITFGKEKYIVKPKDGLGRTKVEQYNDGKLQHWYVAKPQARKIGEFAKVIEDSYADDATFMNAVRITKYTEEGSIVLKNLFLTEMKSWQCSTIKMEFKNIASVVQEKFGIPADVVEEAISSLKELKDIYN